MGARLTDGWPVIALIATSAISSACSDAGCPSTTIENEAGECVSPDDDDLPLIDTALDTDTDADTDGYGTFAVTWSTPGGYTADSLVVYYESGATEAEAVNYWDGSFTDSSKSSISFPITVPEGGYARYSITATFGTITDYSCESTSSNESQDALMGTHAAEYEADDGSTCSISVGIYHKGSGADGCEPLIGPALCP